MKLRVGVRLRVRCRSRAGAALRAGEGSGGRIGHRRLTLRSCPQVWRRCGPGRTACAGTTFTAPGSSSRRMIWSSNQSGEDTHHISQPVSQASSAAPLSTHTYTTFSGQFRLGGSAVRRPFGHDSAAGISELVALHFYRIQCRLSIIGRKMCTCTRTLTYSYKRRRIT